MCLFRAFRPSLARVWRFSRSGLLFAAKKRCTLSLCLSPLFFFSSVVAEVPADLLVWERVVARAADEQRQKWLLGVRVGMRDNSGGKANKI